MLRIFVFITDLAPTIFASTSVVFLGDKIMSKHPGTTIQSQEFPSWEVKSNKLVQYYVEESKEIFALENFSILSRGFEENCQDKRCLIVIDENVHRLYGEKIIAYFEHHNIAIKILTINSKESEKNLDTAKLVVKAINEFNVLRRSEPLIGIGGGVVLDIVGLVSSLYRRGIPYIRIPTTLMGLVDAGIGIKTGINFDLDKNRLGTYHPPLAAYLDRSFLNTLDERHMSNGLAEILKIALIKDERLFQLLECNAENIVSSRLQGHLDYDEIFYRAIQGMLEELEPNLWEDKLERAVDYGHSFSPSIEMKALPELLHGEAVNVDMVFSLILAKQRDFLSCQDFERVLGVMQHLNLPISHELCNYEFLQQALEDTVKHRNGLQRLPITAGIGNCIFVNDISNDEIRNGVAEFQRISNKLK